MAEEKVVYSGYLLVPPTGKIVIKKSWQQKFCLLYKKSKFGIERLEIYDDIGASKHSPHRIITLENCIKITQKTTTLFSIITKTATHDFGTVSELALNQWMNGLQSVAFRDDISRATIVEDNDLYCSSGEGVFSVKLYRSDASERCGLDPINYTLVLTPTALQLRSSVDNKLLFTWPYCFIRRYGHKEGKFTFEAGRKCETGEGTFFLEHCNQQEIFRCIASKMKSMKKLLKGESSPAILDCGDNQFQAALTMEPRSRSPLPPSPTSSTSLQDFESHVSKSSERSNPLFKSTRVDKEFFALKKPEDDVLKKQTPPAKPPRKAIPIQPEPDNYELIKKYDEIEYRSNAWQEYGVNDVQHTENEMQDVEYFSWGTKERKQTTSKVVNEPSLTQSSYDKLSFFGSSSKLFSSNAGYRQVVPTPVVAAAYPPPAYNDYDEVTISMESARLADDSHLGYAMIRKNTKVDHQFYNGEPYAVVSKPKRV